MRVLRVEMRSSLCTVAAVCGKNRAHRVWHISCSTSGELFIRVTMTVSVIKYKRIDVDGFGVAYREAGPVNGPTLLLLHGFPTSSHMFRDLIPKLADRYRVVAPDLPGFGQSDLPSRERFNYTFSNLAKVMARFTELLKLNRFAMYIFDYGAPTGLRMAVENPERATAII